MEPPVLLGLFTFVLGLLVVFLGMFVLVLFVSAMGKFFNRKPKDEVEEQTAEQTAEPVLVANDESDEIPEHVKVAIIAAISCYYQDAQSKNEFIVKKIKKINN